MLEQNEPKLIGFFDELVEDLIPKTRSFYNQEEAKNQLFHFVIFLLISYSTFEIDKFESIDNLTIHLYDDAILEYKEERSIKDLQLVDFKELELHSFENYADAFKMIINVPNHLIII
ncbi:hypothetical protein F8M41_015371 [Gigaspora margarita]|uniref:Uncharacterized protein n=1 Tax=Gigaspora margarita TaxID=4874 RepID=A0A8H4ENI7_GIGMA|nr:hypothetical protein F8M41_015371 [Gigaspora margarita]